MSSDSSNSLRKQSVSVAEGKKDSVVGEKLIEIEETEKGSVKWAVYKHYLQYIGIFFTSTAIVFSLLFQGIEFR